MPAPDAASPSPATPTATAGSVPVVSVPDDEYAAALADVEGVEIVTWDLQAPHPRGSEIRYAVVPYMAHVRLEEVTAGMDALSAVQLQSAGFETHLPHVPAGVRLCNAAGVHDASTAELAVGLTIASIRRIPESVAAQQDSYWPELTLGESLADKRVLVVGYGRIGKAIARRFAPFEVSLTAVASRARDGDELVGHVHGVDELPELVARHDVVVLVVPLTERTRGLVDADLLARMPDGALVVNVARGPVVVTDALQVQCATGRLRAALDVTDPEPLPPGHPLWTTPGVLVTPHVGGATSAMRPRALAMIRGQLEALRDGRPLANVVNAAQG